jgi:hypothetical protein
MLDLDKRDGVFNGTQPFAYARTLKEIPFQGQRSVGIHLLVDKYSVNITHTYLRT